MRQPATADPRTTSWSHRLSTQHVVELDAAMTSLRRSERPLLTVRRSDFALPTLSTELRSIAGQVDERDGLAAHRYNAHRLRMLLWAVGQHLGTPVSQTADGHTWESPGYGGSGGRGGVVPRDVVSLPQRGNVAWPPHLATAI